MKLLQSASCGSLVISSHSFAGTLGGQARMNVGSSSTEYCLTHAKSITIELQVKNNSGWFAVSKSDSTCPSI